MCRLASLALCFHFGLLDLDFLVMTPGLLDPFLGQQGLFRCFGVFPILYICIIPLTVELFPHSFPSPSPFPSPAPYADHSKMLTYRSILVVEASGRRFWIRGCFR